MKKQGFKLAIQPYGICQTSIHCHLANCNTIHLKQYLFSHSIIAYRLKISNEKLLFPVLQRCHIYPFFKVCSKEG